MRARAWDEVIPIKIFGATATNANPYVLSAAHVEALLRRCPPKALLPFHCHVCGHHYARLERQVKNGRKG